MGTGSRSGNGKAPEAAGAEEEVVGVAVVAREAVIVLGPKDGKVLYRLETGNMIVARPLADGARIYAGGADNGNSFLFGKFSL